MRIRNVALFSKPWERKGSGAAGTKAFQSAAVQATLKVLADHQAAFGQDCCKHKCLEREREGEKLDKNFTAFPSFHLHGAPVSHLSFYLFFAHLQIKAIMARPSQGDILGNFLSLAEITAVCYLKYNGRD